jgi:hypothetical protein
MAIVGCDDDRAAVQGTVTLDGQDSEGIISFVPTNGRSTSAAWAEIKQGRYSLPAAQGPAVGNYRVEISWMRKNGKKFANVANSMLAEQIAEAIPARYNQKSELKADITPGKNQLDFTLTSK